MRNGHSETFKTTNSVPVNATVASEARPCPRGAEPSALNRFQNFGVAFRLSDDAHDGFPAGAVLSDQVQVYSMIPAEDDVSTTHADAVGIHNSTERRR
jgi:hypothetical protein